jgi:arylsulfatase
MEIVGGADSVPDEVDGISMVPTLLGQPQSERPYLYREFPGYGGQQTIRVGQWKAVRQNMSQGNLEIELYNLADDIGEQHDVSQDHPQRVAEMARLMETVRTPSAIFPLIPLDGPLRGGRQGSGKK